MQAPTLGNDVTLTLPADDGTADQVLQTNGSGVLNWATPGSAAPSFGYHPNVDEQADEAFVKMAEVNGVDYGLFYEKYVSTGATWGSASNSCLIAGKRLPDYHEWRMACDGKTDGIAGQKNQTSFGGWEWASSRPSAVVSGSFNGAGSVVAGGGSCDDVTMGWAALSSDGSGNIHTFRCVR